jgi:hypothetical protein
MLEDTLRRGGPRLYQKPAVMLRMRLKCITGKWPWRMIDGEH